MQKQSESHEQITPRRKKFYQIHVTLLVTWLVLTVGATIACCIINFATLWWVGALCVLGAVSGVFVFLSVKGKVDYYDSVDELERLSYLFKDVELSPDDLLEVEGLEDDGVDFVLSKAGLRVKLREGGEQVFGDGMDDGKFYAWEDLDLYLAASNEFHRVNLGLAVMSKQPTGFFDENEPTNEDEIFYILPMCRNLALALRGFCMQYLMVDWQYVFYQPLDAFLQIMKKGRVEKFYDRNTGEELTEEFCQNKLDETNE
jgi:hypothetical protein